MSSETGESSKRGEELVSSTKILLRSSYKSPISNIIILGLVIVIGLLSKNILDREDKVLPIYVGENTTRIITEETDPILQKELVNFILSFVDNYYSFDSGNIEERMNLATDLMTEKWFRIQKDKIKTHTQKIAAREFSQKAKVLNITREDNGDFTVDLTVVGKNRLNNFSQKYKVTILIDKAKRTELNKWGLEVAFVKETRI